MQAEGLQYIGNLILKVDDDDDKKKAAIQVGVFMTIPFVLALPPIVGWFIGKWIDEKLGTDPYVMYFLLILGLIAGFREMLRIVKRYGNGT